MTPWLTIIIPIYNVENYIRKCLNSIVIDNVKFLDNVEIILVDDGSTDASGQIADRYAMRYSFLRVIHKKNSGVAAARNTGMNAACGDWIYFMDSDDWLEPGAIDKIQRSCNKHSDSDILLFDAYQNKEDVEKPWEHFREACVWETGSDINRLQRGMLYFPMAYPFKQIPLAAPWDKVYRKAFLAANELYFAEYLKVLDDMVFNMEVFGAAARVAYCKEKIYHYRYVSNSITNSYRPDRLKQDMEVWDYICQYMNKRNWNETEKELFEQAYYCRIVKSFSICCRLLFFNPQNQMSVLEQLNYVKAVLSMKPYNTAFHTVKMRYAEWRLKIMIVFCRCRWVQGIWLLHVAQTAKDAF